MSFNWPDPKAQTKTPISRAFDDEIIIINLPDYVDPTETSKIKWLSVWCEQFTISFGDIVFNSKDPKENACA